MNRRGFIILPSLVVYGLAVAVQGLADEPPASKSSPDSFDHRVLYGEWASAAVVALMAAHGILIVYVASHVIASAAVAGGVIALIVFKHVGLWRPLYGALRKTRYRP